MTSSYETGSGDTGNDGIGVNVGYEIPEATGPVSPGPTPVAGGPSGVELAETLDQVASLVRNCTDCPLAGGRINAVPGEGNPQAEVMFIGEGPGFQEDRQGRPFVGPAGKLLDGLLASIGTNRRPRIEPQKRWPRRSPCAKPVTLIARQPGDQFALQVEFHDGRKHLPLVSLKRAA